MDKFDRVERLWHQYTSNDCLPHHGEVIRHKLRMLLDVAALDMSLIKHEGLLYHVLIVNNCIRLMERRNHG